MLLIASQTINIATIFLLMTKIKDITAVIEQAAPLKLQESYDNSGLIVGNLEAEVKSALLCVDITEAVMDEAEELGVGLIISHHPIIFHPLKKITGSDYVQRVVERAIKNDIALYASHTNLDAVKGGMSYKLADILGVGGVELLSQSTQTEEEAGFGVIGELENAMVVSDFFDEIKEKLNVKVIRHSDICVGKIKKVAICTGGGASLINTAAELEADLYIAADFKYNDFLDADGRLIVADIGHFESEYCAIDLLYEIITKKIATFALHKSQKLRNPVYYSI